MTQDVYPIETRIHTTKDGVKLFLVPNKSCSQCVAGRTEHREKDVTLCHALPPCGEDDGWVVEAEYIKWVAEVRMN